MQLEMLLPWILLVFVNISLILRRIQNIEIPAWSAFLLASVLLIASDKSQFNVAIEVIIGQIEVFIFLFTMIVIVTGLELSGYLKKAGSYLLLKSNTQQKYIFLLIFGFGFSSSILLNDTVAIIGPLIIIIMLTGNSNKVNLNKNRSDNKIQENLNPFVYQTIILSSLLLAYSISIGSALLPTGNPQNYILAYSGNVPLYQFFCLALFPTILTAICLFFYFKNKIPSFDLFKTNNIQELVDHQLINKSLGNFSVLCLVGILFGLFISPFIKINTSVILLIIVGLFLFFRNERDEILAQMNWGIFVFFAGMFVVINAVSNSPQFLKVVEPIFYSFNNTFYSFMIFVTIIFISSQVFSNVPVAIIIANLLPLHPEINIPIFWVGAAIATTFAGTTTILGAASNIIVLETIRSRGYSFTWLQFTKYGLIVSFFAFLSLGIFGWIYFIIT
jgi:Na+/H+ antiporter NhaD/arsenite permease-like protein